MPIFLVWGFGLVQQSLNLSLKPEPQIKEAPPKEGPVASGPSLTLDGQSFQVDWDDGDTFSYVDPKTKKGERSFEWFNTRILWAGSSVGRVDSERAYDLAKEAGVFARAQVWTCSDTKKEGVWTHPCRLSRFARCHHSSGSCPSLFCGSTCTNCRFRSP